MNFNDLRFQHHIQFQEAVQAVLKFRNGFGVSVVGGEYTGLYGDGINTFEVAIIHDNIILGDVFGWCSKEDVTKIIKQVKRNNRRYMKKMLQKDCIYGILRKVRNSS